MRIHKMDGGIYPLGVQRRMLLAAGQKQAEQIMDARGDDVFIGHGVLHINQEPGKSTRDSVCV